MTVDEAKLESFKARVLGDLGAAVSAMLMHIGDKLGLYEAMADGRPITAAALAARTGTSERYIVEWLNNQAAGRYVDFHPTTGTYSLPPEHAVCLSDEDDPAYLLGILDVIASTWAIEPRVTEAFRTGEGVPWADYDERLANGCPRSTRPQLLAHLLSDWLPALDGVDDKLRQGARVADVGCGHGAAAILMAQAHPRSTFVGYDSHDASIATARKAAAHAGVADRVAFEVASAADFPGGDYDLVTMFDCLHELGDPVAAAHHIRSALAPTGCLMVVELQAGDGVEDNLHPLGRALYGLSALVCTPVSLAQEGAAALGAQAGEKRLAAVLADAGFTSVRRATDTTFNFVLEARP